MTDAISIPAYMIVRDDGLYIEQNRDKGATHKEPGKRLPPRLWFKKHQAQSWLTTYCKGTQIARYVEYVDWETGYREANKVVIKTLPVEGRTIDRFTILPIIIKGAAHA